MATETITLKLVAQDLMSGNVTKAIGSIDRLAKQGGLVGSMAQGVGQSIGQMLNPLTVATKAFDLLTDGLGKTVSGLTELGRAYKQDQAEQAQLQNTIMRNIDNWEQYTGAIDEAILAGQRLAFSDTEQRESLARLITATRDARRAIVLNRLAMDIARQRNIRLAESSQAVAKAAQGQFRGLKSLNYIVKLTATSTENLASVTDQAAGSAETWASTAQGKLAVRLLNITEQAEANGASFQALDGIQQDLALSSLEAANGMVMYLGVMMDFLGVGKNAEGQTIRQAQEFDILGRKVQAIGWKYGRMAMDMAQSSVAATQSIRGLVQVAEHTVVDMRDAIKNGKAEVIEQFRDLAWQSKHPFAQVRYETWLRKKQAEAVKLMAEAVKNNKWRLVAQYQSMITGIKTELWSLPGYAAWIAQETLRSMAPTLPGNFRFDQPDGGGRRWVKGHWRKTNNGRKWVKGHWEDDNGGSPHRPPDGELAHGGTARAGGLYLVGERGPELLRMGTSAGTIIPNHRMGGAIGGGITVNVTHIGSLSEAEGDRLAAVIEKPLRRRMARSGA